MLYYPLNARGEEQRQKMLDLEASGTCIYCPEHLGPAGNNRILLSNTTWALVTNAFPYPGSLHHMMLVPVEHVSRLTELSPMCREGYWDILERMERELNLDYHVDGVRNGDPAFTGGTIVHLHIQVIVSDPNHNGEPPKIYAGSFPSSNPSLA
jgi:diadenosine tetraphosphate (Ap4A) HIT family hydrolase